ncbi:MAG: iron-containing alcohol dehydrogenase, partial [Bacteroidaceae bacterium]|nr:iron-containing alcohol dehydrogenase [Bacteroidaceae bacterium]
MLLSSYTSRVMQQIIYAQNLCGELDALVAQIAPDRVFVLTDTTTQECCLPLLKSSVAVSNAQHITIGSTDASKTLESLATVWEALGNGGGSRHSLLLCLGGGMVTDLGGFAAATFKRGIPYINIPTTLLAM